MRRHLFNLLAIVSLLLCVTIAGSWIRSYWVADSWIWSDGADFPPRVYRMGHRYVVTVSQGHVYVMNDTSWWFPQQFRYLRIDDPAWANPPFVPLRSVLGFEWAEYVGTPMAANVPVQPFVLHRIFGIPHWFLALPTMILPASWWIKHRRHKRRVTNNLCLKCGYDLRATPERCPECGTIPPQKVAE